MEPRSVQQLIESISKDLLYLQAHVDDLVARSDLDEAVNAMLNLVEELEQMLETTAERTELLSNTDNLMQ